MLNKAKTSRPRPRPKLRGLGRGQDYEVEAEAKNKYENRKVSNNDNNVWFKIIAEKLTKFPNLTRFLHEKCPIT